MPTTPMKISSSYCQDLPSKARKGLEGAGYRIDEDDLGFTATIEMDITYDGTDDDLEEQAQRETGIGHIVGSHVATSEHAHYEATEINPPHRNFEWDG